MLTCACAHPSPPHQGCRMRNTKTEYVSCPSCGRTLFNLQASWCGSSHPALFTGTHRMAATETPRHTHTHIFHLPRLLCSFSPRLQEVTEQIRTRTGHLPGVSIAIMGCIVNGPGEMADADFG